MEFILNEIDIILIITSICLLIYGLYSKIKFECLKKASELVSKIEEDDKLTAEEKFATVLFWINEDLPLIFSNATFKAVTEEIVKYVYKYFEKYANNYIKNKTGMDLEEIVENVEEKIKETNQEENNQENKK